jgi:flagellar basal body-associated protein FliL
MVPSKPGAAECQTLWIAVIFVVIFFAVAFVFLLVWFFSKADTTLGMPAETF